MRYLEITEARSNNNRFPKTNPLDALSKYYGKGYYASFTANVGANTDKPVPRIRANSSGHKVGINPQSAHDTPMGVYTYPVDYIVDSAMSVEYAGDQPFIQVLELTASSDRVWYLHETSGDEVARIYRYLEEKYPDVGLASARVYKGARSAFYAINNVVGHISSETGRKPSVIFNKILRDIGYDVIVDYDPTIGDGDGIIHINEPTQAVFLVPSAYKHVETIHNIKPSVMTGSYAYYLLKSKKATSEHYYKISNEVLYDTKSFPPDVIELFIDCYNSPSELKKIASSGLEFGRSFEFDNPIREDQMLAMISVARHPYNVLKIFPDSVTKNVFRAVSTIAEGLSQRVSGNIHEYIVRWPDIGADVIRNNPDFISEELGLLFLLYHQTPMPSVLIDALIDAGVSSMMFNLVREPETIMTMTPKQLAKVVNGDRAKMEYLLKNIRHKDALDHVKKVFSKI